MAARAQFEGALDADKLVTEITNNYGGTATKTGTGFPVNATVDGTLRPQATLTRAQAAKLLLYAQ